MHGDIKIYSQKKMFIFLKYIDLFQDRYGLASKTLAINVPKMETLPKTFSDHSLVSLTFKRKKMALLGGD